MKKIGLLGHAAAAMAISLLMAAPACAGEAVIPEGVFVGEFSLGGKTKSQAQEEIQTYVDFLADRKVTLDVEGETVETNAKELGFSWSNPEAVDEAAAAGTEGNLIQQYMSRMDLQKEPLKLELKTAADAGKVNAFVTEQCQGMTAEPVDAVIVRENGAFQITPGQAGMAVDAEATKAALDQAFAETEGDISVKAVVIKQEPAVTEEDLASIQDVLGTFSTNFNSSNASRAGNVRNGATKINGHVLMPGETLSGYECLSPFTTANGYYAAASYENGRVVDSIGGGVCQLSTTLYQAALRAELEIVQRQNHSMIVTYVKPSMDAAIAGTVKDLKFTNNYSTPIYVEGGTEGGTLTFTIYGKETRPANRNVEFVSETLKRIDPGAPERRVDSSMKPGSSKQIQSSHVGMQSQLWKVVTVDGVETERTLLHADTYNASKAIVLVGPSAPPQDQPAAAPAEPQPETPAPTTAPAVVEGVNGGPGVTAEPSQTQAAPEPQGPGAAPAPEPQSEPAPAPEPQPAPAPAPEAAGPAGPGV